MGAMNFSEEKGERVGLRGWGTDREERREGRDWAMKNKYLIN